MPRLGAQSLRPVAVAAVALSPALGAAPSAPVSAEGVVDLSIPGYKHKSGHTLTVRYLGTALFAPSETTVSFAVSNT